MKSNTQFGHILHNSSYNEKYLRQKLYRKLKNILSSIIFFSENRTFYEIMWRKIVQPAKPQTTI